MSFTSHIFVLLVLAHLAWIAVLLEKDWRRARARSNARPEQGENAACRTLTEVHEPAKLAHRR